MAFVHSQKKTELPNRQPGHLPLHGSVAFAPERPAAFRPTFAGGLALSEICLDQMQIAC